MKFIRKLSKLGLLAIVAQISAASDSDSDSSNGCAFTLVSSSGVECPASQLPDGQIRLNGTENIATFYIADGKITDSDGRGCIVTDAPTTQIQCDEGKAPEDGFSIDSSNELSYLGYAQFYACPASETEYNIYVQPNFGQTKCFGITLKASGCGDAPISPPASSTLTCPTVAPSTLTEICTVTETSTATTTETCTVTETDTGLSTTTETLTWISMLSQPCTTSESASSSKSCHKCTATATNGTSNYSSTKPDSTTGTTRLGR